MSDHGISMSQFENRGWAKLGPAVVVVVLVLTRCVWAVELVKEVETSVFKRGEGVEIARAVTSKEDMASQVILYRKTKSIKFDSTIIVSSKLTDINEIFNNVKGDKYIIKMKGAVKGWNNDMVGVSDENGIPITNMNMRKNALIKNGT
ncbi:hypothetical protein Tco_1332050 [Tanacetum coccineum]